MILGSVLITNRNKTNDSWQTQRVQGWGAAGSRGCRAGSGFPRDLGPRETHVGQRPPGVLGVLVRDVRVSDEDL